MKPEIDYSIYLVTDSELMSTETLMQAVEQAIKGGCTLVQLREKELSSLDFYDTALKVKAITSGYNIPLIINDRVDIAMAVDAEGVHIGQSDLPAKIVRRLIGNDKIMGISVSCLSEAVQAEKDGADYLGVGAMFATETKTDVELVSIDTLKHIIQKIDLPIVVIGGINKNTIPMFTGIGIDGIAIVSAIISERDIAAAAHSLKSLFEDINGERYV